MGVEGGLALMWKNHLNIWIKSSSSNHIEAEVSKIGKPGVLTFVGFYGKPWLDNKWESWRLLNWLGATNPNNVLYCGDFNEIISNEEKLGGGPWSTSHMSQFWNILHTLSLKDLGFTGYPFTWRRGSGLHGGNWGKDW